MTTEAIALQAVVVAHKTIKSIVLIGIKFFYFRLKKSYLKAQLRSVIWLHHDYRFLARDRLHTHIKIWNRSQVKRPLLDGYNTCRSHQRGAWTANSKLKNINTALFSVQESSVENCDRHQILAEERLWWLKSVAKMLWCFYVKYFLKKIVKIVYPLY